MTEKSEVASETVSLPPNYAPSETFTDSPPPAYPIRRGGYVQVAKIVCMTILAVSFLAGCFSLTATWLNSKNSCDCSLKQQELLNELRSAGFVELPQFSKLTGAAVKVTENDLTSQEEEVKDNDPPQPVETSPQNKAEEEVVLPEQTIQVAENTPEVEEEEENEADSMKDRLEAQLKEQLKELKKNIKMPIDLLLGNPNLAGRNVECQVENKRQDIGGGIITQAIIVTCEDSNKGDQPTLIPLPLTKDVRPPLSLLAPIMKMLRKKNRKNRRPNIESVIKSIMREKPDIIIKEISGPVPFPLSGPFPRPPAMIPTDVIPGPLPILPMMPPHSNIPIPIPPQGRAPFLKQIHHLNPEISPISEPEPMSHGPLPVFRGPMIPNGPTFKEDSPSMFQQNQRIPVPFDNREPEFPPQLPIGAMPVHIRKLIQAIPREPFNRELPGPQQGPLEFPFRPPFPVADNELEKLPIIRPIPPENFPLNDSDGEDEPRTMKRIRLIPFSFNPLRLLESRIEPMLNNLRPVNLENKPLIPAGRAIVIKPQLSKEQFPHPVPEASGRALPSPVGVPQIPMGVPQIRIRPNIIQLPPPPFNGARPQGVRDLPLIRNVEFQALHDEEPQLPEIRQPFGPKEISEFGPPKIHTVLGSPIVIAGPRVEPRVPDMPDKPELMFPVRLNSSPEFPPNMAPPTFATEERPEDVESVNPEAELIHPLPQNHHRLIVN